MSGEPVQTTALQDRKKYMYGFEISLLGYKDAISLAKLHGNKKRQNATKLEMDQLHEFNTFHDKGIGTTPGEEFKKIQVYLLVYGCNHRILSCSVLWGVTIFPYVDKWTRAHVIREVLLENGEPHNIHHV
jgi:hypothetical protein